MNVKIPDDLALDLEAIAQTHKLSLDAYVTKQLTRFGRVPVTQRIVLLTGEDLQAIETQLAGGFLSGGADLRARIARWAGITIGGIRLNFSEAQLAEIQHRAERQGKPPAVLVQEIVQQMEQNFFWEPAGAR